MRTLFLTVSDRHFFPGTLATCNSIRRFHPDAEIAVVVSDVYNRDLSAAQHALLSAHGVRIVSGAELGARSARRVPGAWQLKAYGALDLSEGYDLLVGVDSDLLLCGPIDDVMEQAVREDVWMGGKDGSGVQYDGSYAPYGIAAPARNPDYMSTSLYFCPLTPVNREVLGRWAACCDRAVFGPQPEKVFPGHGDQGVLNALLFQERDRCRVKTLPNETWSQHWTYWQSILRFVDGRILNLSTGGQPQRAIHCSGGDKPWQAEHAKRVRTGEPLQMVNYAWFLYLLWFGPIRDWSVDPYQYLAPESHHLVAEAAYCFPRIAAFDPGVREAWDEFTTVPVLMRMRREAASFMPLEGSMQEYLRLARTVPPAGRVVEVGSYHGGSAVTLALGLLNRDVTVYSVESFAGNPDGTVDGLPLPSPATYEYMTHAVHPHLRLVTVPAPSVDAAAGFADGSLDMLFLDGGHDLEAVSRDIETWLPKLKSGSIMAGDDYDWDGVREAAKRYFGRVEHCGAVWHCRPK